MLGLRSGIAAFAVALLAGAGAVAACDGSTVLLEDDFSEFQSVWGKPDAGLRVEGGRMVMTPKAEYTEWVSNKASLFDDVDLCSDVTTVKSVVPDASSGGLIFWYADEDNFYAFELDAAGSASVSRLQNGRWLRQVGWRKVGSLKTGDGETNTLRVVTKGNVATYYVNGEELAEAKGAPPATGHLVGLIAASPKKGQAIYAFSNFKVTQPD